MGNENVFDDLGFEGDGSINLKRRDLFATFPIKEKQGIWEARYYQHNAIEAVLEAISQGKNQVFCPRHRNLQNIDRFSNCLKTLSSQMEPQRRTDLPPPHTIPRRSQYSR